MSAEKPFFDPGTQEAEIRNEIQNYAPLLRKLSESLTPEEYHNISGLLINLPPDASEFLEPEDIEILKSLALYVPGPMPGIINAIERSNAIQKERNELRNAARAAIDRAADRQFKSF